MQAILTVIGTRPEAIKMAPLLLAMRAAPGIRSLLCVTGQHRHMLDGALAEFGLAADYDLDIMRPHSRQRDVLHPQIMRRMDNHGFDQRG